MIGKIKGPRFTVFSPTLGEVTVLDTSADGHQMKITYRRPQDGDTVTRWADKKELGLVPNPYRQRDRKS